MHSTPLFFFFNDTATTEIYTLSLHDALPISTEQEIDPGRHGLLSDPRFVLAVLLAGIEGRRGGMRHRGRRDEPDTHPALLRPDGDRLEPCAVLPGVDRRGVLAQDAVDRLLPARHGGRRRRRVGHR